MRCTKSLALSALLMLCGLSGLLYAEPTLVGPTKVEPYHLVDLSIGGASSADDLIFWDLTEEAVADIREKGTSFLFTGPPGVYHLKVRVISVKDGKIVGSGTMLRSTITIGIPTPVPPGPPGPEPKPPVPPNPPEPVPPIPGLGLRVLMLEDSAQRTKLTAAQQNVLTGRTVRDYLNQKCIVGPDGKTHDWRIWDKDVDPSGEEKVWQDVVKRPHASMPWIIVSNGKTGYEGPLPSSPEEALKLLKRYGGE